MVSSWPRCKIKRINPLIWVFRYKLRLAISRWTLGYTTLQASRNPTVDHKAFTLQLKLEILVTGIQLGYA